MPFHEDMLFIVDLLPEPHHCFLWIHFFDVAGAPSSPTLNLIPVTSPAAWELYPGTELPLVDAPLPLIRRQSMNLLAPASFGTWPL